MRGIEMGIKLALCVFPACCIALQQPHCRRSRVPCSLSMVPRGEGEGNKFVPAFVGVWAVGYSTLAILETSGGEGLGDAGGAIAVAGVVSLALLLVAVSVYETFKE